MIAIIGAMDVEVEAILSRMDLEEGSTYMGLDIYKGRIGEKEVILCKSGVGKVNAAITTTLLLSKYDIEYIINVGTAGGMVDSQETLDIVISDRVIQHDFDTSYIDGPEGLGIYAQADKDLADRVRRAFESNQIEANIYVGDIISGDIFVGEDSKVLELKEKFPTAIACEMEAGAIGQVAQRLGIPFIVIRSLSDIVSHDNSGIDFMANVKFTSERSAQMVEKFLSL